MCAWISKLIWVIVLLSSFICSLIIKREVSHSHLSWFQLVPYDHILVLVNIIKFKKFSWGLYLYCNTCRWSPLTYPADNYWVVRISPSNSTCRLVYNYCRAITESTLYLIKMHYINLSPLFLQKFIL